MSVEFFNDYLVDAMEFSAKKKKKTLLPKIVQKNPTPPKTVTHQEHKFNHGVKRSQRHTH